jgi:hypothetical protein
MLERRYKAPLGYSIPQFLGLDVRYLGLNNSLLLGGDLCIVRSALAMGLPTRSVSIPIFDNQKF